MSFKKGDLVRRQHDELYGTFWNIREVREANGVEGVYVVRHHEGVSLWLEGLTRVFDVRKFIPAHPTTKISDWM